MNETLTAALNLLSRREHGAQELTHKLVQKGHDPEEVAAAISHCQELNLQSDQRFVETMLQVRMRQGYGPRRVRYELAQKEIAVQLIEDVLAAAEIDWCECAQKVLQKKYKSLRLKTYIEQQKQKQFLLYRGFTTDIIATAIES